MGFQLFIELDVELWMNTIGPVDRRGTKKKNFYGKTCSI